MNDVLMVERLITAYNNKYSAVKQANYSNQSSADDKVLQRGMERILAEALYFKMGITHRRKYVSFAKAAVNTFPSVESPSSP